MGRAPAVGSIWYVLDDPLKVELAPRFTIGDEVGEEAPAGEAAASPDALRPDKYFW